MTEVTIKLFATLRDGRFSIETRELQPGASVGVVVQELGIPERDAALILVNGRHADIATELHEGDTLAIFPPIGGG